jgi:CheY-like chemotaxis protein
MPRNILLVEDDEALRYAIAADLRAAGLTVVAVADGLAALAELDDGRFDLLLTDVQLPRGGPHGLSLANMVRHRHGIPVIFITGHREVLEAERFLPGKVFYKPIDLDALILEINREFTVTLTPPPPSPEDAVRIRRWRQKAEELRTTSDSFGDNSASAGLRRAAATYDGLADNAEARREPKMREPEAG